MANIVINTVTVPASVASSVDSDEAVKSIQKGNMTANLVVVAMSRRNSGPWECEITVQKGRDPSLLERRYSDVCGLTARPILNLAKTITACRSRCQLSSGTCCWRWYRRLESRSSRR